MEANSKPMYQPWNEEEFQADVFVRGMTWVQRHLYRALLQAMFFHGTRPYLPKDDDVLWVLAGAESPEMWETNKTRILKRFTTCSHNENLLENKRVTADWERLTDARRKMSELGQRSAAVRSALNGGSTTVQRPSGARCLVVNGGATSEVEVDLEIKKVEQKSETGADVSSFSQESKPLGGDWKSLAIRHKRYFGKKASTVFKSKYAEACATYGEQVVLECFDAWAPGALSWVQEKNVDQPLHSFFKKLPDEAADTIETTAAMKEEDELVESTKRKGDEAQAASIERQTQDIVKLMRSGEQPTGESLEDFMKDGD